MDDEDLYETTTVEAHKHTKWSFIVLAVDLAASITQDVASTLTAATAALMQHRQHLIEQDKFYEITED